MQNRARKRLRLLRGYAAWYRNNAIFIHVPKVAGTSISHSVYGRTLGHFYASEIRSSFPKLYDRAFVFAFVRNPWSRAVSAYKFARAGGTEAMGIYRPEQYQIPEFDTFEKFLKGWLPGQNIHEVDNVFKEQILFVADDQGKIILDYLGKFENIDAGVDVIRKKISKNLVVRRMNSGGPEDYKKYYKDNEMVDIVGALYSRDIDSFCYEFE